MITSHKTFLEFFFVFVDFLILSQLLAMDASARVTMKDAAKCDKRCEWQNSANQENAQRILHLRVIPVSTLGSGSSYFNASKDATARGCYLGVRFCAPAMLDPLAR